MDEFILRLSVLSSGHANGSCSPLVPCLFITTHHRTTHHTCACSSSVCKPPQRPFEADSESRIQRDLSPSCITRTTGQGCTCSSSSPERLVFLAPKVKVEAYHLVPLLEYVLLVRWELSDYIQGNPHLILHPGPSVT